MSDSEIQSSIIDEIYLPFTADELRSHFLVDADAQIAYFKKSAVKYSEFMQSHPDRKGVPINESRRPCQIEKDE